MKDETITVGGTIALTGTAYASIIIVPEGAVVAGCTIALPNAIGGAAIRYGQVVKVTGTIGSIKFDPPGRAMKIMQESN